MEKGPERGTNISPKEPTDRQKLAAERRAESLRKREAEATALVAGNPGMTIEDARRRIHDAREKARERGLQKLNESKSE